MSKRTDEDENDNVIYVNGPDEAMQSNLDNKKRIIKQRRIMLAILVVLFIAGIGVIYSFVHREYRGYRVLKSNETNYENTASYVQFCGNLLKYTPDGVSYINTSGDIVWSAGINMKMPVAVVSEGYAAIADMSGNSVCIFNETGAVSSLTMPYAISDVDVAKQGAFAVVLESDKTNYINLYDKSGSIVYEMQSTIDKSGYPLDITISDDGQKLFTSYINVTGTNASNYIGAYNFGEVGQNSNADRMVGGYKFEEQVIPKVEFIDNNTVVAFGTNVICVYSMKEKPSEKARINFDDEIRSIFYSGDFIGVVQSANEAGHMFKLKTYDVYGKLKFEDYIDFNYNNVYAAEKEIIVSGESECVIYRTNGSIKFRGSLSGSIASIVPSGNRLEYVVVYDDRTEIIKLKTDEAEIVNDTGVNSGNGEDSDIKTKSNVIDSVPDDEVDKGKKAKKSKDNTSEEQTTMEQTTEEQTTASETSEN